MAELRNSSQMFPIVEAWQQSRQTQEEFCKSYGMSKHVLSYWVCKYRKAHRSDDEPKPAAASFVQVNAQPSESCSSMEIVMPTGVVIRFADQVSVSYLQQLLKTCSL